MRIVCPACSAAYEVKDALLVSGRPVRCARCAEEWTPVPIAEAPLPEPEPFEETPEPPLREPPAPRLTAMERLASHPAVLPRRDPRLPAAWLASVALLLAAALCLVVWRAELMHAWPPSTRLFDAIGLGPAPGPH